MPPRGSMAGYVISLKCGAECRAGYAWPSEGGAASALSTQPNTTVAAYDDGTSGVVISHLAIRPCGMVLSLGMMVIRTRPTSTTQPTHKGLCRLDPYKPAVCEKSSRSSDLTTNLIAQAAPAICPSCSAKRSRMAHRYYRRSCGNARFRLLHRPSAQPMTGRRLLLAAVGTAIAGLPPLCMIGSICAYQV